MKLHVSYCLMLSALTLDDNAYAFLITHTAQAHQCCTALATAPGLDGKIFYPNSSVYEERLESYFSASAALFPWCMAMPTATEDVSQIAKIISTNDCPFGIRGGGHDNPTTKRASIQPGANWGGTYYTLQEHNVTAAGGRTDVVGVGGFITGGGYSFHSGTRGFACDEVHNFEVVLYNGDVVEANANENPDLWRALKGSSGNLAFVTRFDMYTIPSAELWGGALLYEPESKKDKMVEAYIKFSENMASDEASQSILHMIYGAGEYNLKLMLSNTEAKPAAPAFNNYFAISNVSDTTRVRTVLDLGTELTANTPLGEWANWWTGTVKNDIDMAQFLYDKHREYTSKVLSAIQPDTSLTFVVQLQPIPATFFQHCEEKGGNVLGLERVVADGTAQNWLLVTSVDNAADEAAVMRLSKEFAREVDEHATTVGMNLDWAYLNYAWRDQEPIGKYGSEAVGFIKDAAAKYDPRGVFQNLRRSGFKVPE